MDGNSYFHGSDPYTTVECTETAQGDIVVVVSSQPTVRFDMSVDNVLVTTKVPAKVLENKSCQNEGQVLEILHRYGYHVERPVSVPDEATKQHYGLKG